MKYWRGYIVAVVLAACAWALSAFARAHTALVDMVYPYMTRLIQNYLANWSAGVSFCVWLMILLILIACLIASIIVMIIRRWNPIRWFGWVLAVTSFLLLLNTGLYGLNVYAGPISEDLRMEIKEYSVTELTDAAAYFQTNANELSEKVERGGGNVLKYPAFAELAQQAGEGFKVMTYEQSASVLSGSRAPVKVLPVMWRLGKTSGKTVGLTGEAAVNPSVPTVALPWVMCREMAHRMSISNNSDANFAAYLACLNNPSENFQYTANLIAYHFCLEALKTVNTSTSVTAVQTLENGQSFYVEKDLKDYTNYFDHEGRDLTDAMCNLLVNWHRQYVVIPAQGGESAKFDPLDPTQVDLTGIVNANG